MHHALLVFLGGGLGSLGRYLVALGVARVVPADPDPLTSPRPGLPPPASLAATMTVNVLGCLLIGLAWARLGPTMREETRMLVIVGFLGGFTTFSAIGSEGFSLLARGQQAKAGAYLLATIALGLTAVWLGHTLGARPAAG
jgi:CrcB protein